MGYPSSDELDLIQDPETGLALLAKCRSAGETPEQEQDRQFWQLQFQTMRDWQAGDVRSAGLALADCRLFNRRPPLWLLKAVGELWVRCLSDDDKRSHNAMIKHLQRWKAVKLVRGQHPNDPRNFKTKVPRDKVWRAAAKLLLEDTGVEPDEQTVKKSFTLIRRAGGAQVTLPSYKRAVKERDRRRKRQRKKKKKGRPLPE